MDFFSQLILSDTTEASIDWDMTPDLAFCTFNAKGLREDLTSTQERICYFFIDNWGEKPRLYLMERGVRHVNILAEITAPSHLLLDCIIRQGGTSKSRNNYPIDKVVKDWLSCEVIDVEDSPYVVVAVTEKPGKESLAELPPATEDIVKASCVLLPTAKQTLSDEEIESIIKKWNFFDNDRNSTGCFANILTDPGDGLTVIDERTGLMWQRKGLDVCSARSMKRAMERVNQSKWAGYSDWRMPSLAEAMSLLEADVGDGGIHLNACFSKEQPFIFVNARRVPTGYWFVDYKQGRVYWSSGTVPGGFGRLCRRV